MRERGREGGREGGKGEGVRVGEGEERERDGRQRDCKVASGES